jgi:hypothetical protein
MNSLMQVMQSARQSFFVVSPTYTVNAGRGLPLQSIEAVLKRINGYVME